MPSDDPGSDALPVDRAARVLAEAAGRTRVRRREDASDPSVPVAGTAVIVRDAADGPEVLMIERPDRGSFAGAWVFPGGKVEPVDGHADEAVAARNAAVRETREETGLPLKGGGLLPLSCWDPPPGLPLRIRTWFYLSADPMDATHTDPRVELRARTAKRFASGLGVYLGVDNLLDAGDDDLDVIAPRTIYAGADVRL